MAQGTLTGVNNLVSAIVDLVNISFIALITFSVIKVVQKYITEEYGTFSLWKGSIVRLAISLLVYVTFQVYKQDLIVFFGGSPTLEF